MDKKTQGTLEMGAAMAISGTIGWFVVQSGLPALEVVCTGCLAQLPDDQAIYLPWLQAMRAEG